MIQFDVYPRDLKLEHSERGPKVVETNRVVAVDAYTNTFSVGEELVLCKVPIRINVHTPRCELTTRAEEHELTIRKQTPEPLIFANTPPPHIQPSGAYDFVPEVIGGVGPYEFSIDALDPTFEFNSQTGELKRPPQ